MRREPKLLILLALLCAVLACATAPSLNMDANGNALIEVLERHDRMLTVLERLEAQGQLEAIDPALICLDLMAMRPAAPET